MNNGKVGCFSHQFYHDSSDSCSDQSFDSLIQHADGLLSQSVGNLGGNEPMLSLAQSTQDFDDTTAALNLDSNSGCFLRPLDSCRIISSMYPLRLIRDLCFGYGFNTCFDGFENVFDDYFFQIYASKSGYDLSGDFLSNMNRHKGCFSIFIDNLLFTSSSFFTEVIDCDLKRSFKDEMLCLSKRLHKVDVGLPNVVMEFLDRVCNYFSRTIYNFRSKCVFVLQDSIIPEIVKTILDGSIIDCGNERKMTYIEMETFFLYSVTSLERIIMLKTMNVWNDFIKNKEFLISVPPNVDYSDPFARATVSCGVDIPVVKHPAAFNFFDTTNICISFISSSRICRFIKEVSDKTHDALYPIVNDAITIISDHSFDYVTDFKVFRAKTLPVLIERKFSESVSYYQAEFNKIIYELMVWPLREDEVTNLLLLRESVLKSISQSLEERVYNISDIIVGYLSHKIGKFLLRKEGRYCRLVKSKWKINIHPKFDYNILSIKSRFSAKLRSVFCSKFSRLIKDGFPRLPWDNVSVVLFRIVTEEAKDIIADRAEEFSQVVSKVPIANNYDVVALTEDQKCDLASLVINHAAASLKFYAKSLWEKVRTSTKGSRDTAEVVADQEMLYQDSASVVVSDQLVPGVEEESILHSHEFQNLFQEFLDRIVCDGNDYVMSGINELMVSSQSTEEDVSTQLSADYALSAKNSANVTFNIVNQTGEFFDYSKRCYYKIKGGVSPVFVDFGEVSVDEEISKNVGLMIEEYLTNVYDFIKVVMDSLEDVSNSVSIDDINSMVVEKLRGACSDDLSKFVRRLDDFLLDVFILDFDCSRLINADERRGIVGYFYSYLRTQCDQILSNELPGIISMKIK
ncbi:hypothetical protein [Candidatus Ichthyocystis hellenicum]|uniref:hypothetical protein n=1 Tax=Candidatus Ichthyocystis hellenicum TaxID=1561003 RepID=UPI000B8547E1|nr:hypothetical protein [Candidatus Ichthyocystis hellenicum]